MRTEILNDSTALRKIILENPGLPIAILCDEYVNDGTYGWMYAPSVRCEIGEILDCEQDINEGVIFSDRIDFEEELENIIEVEYLHLPNSMLEEKIQEEKAKYEPYWKKCILIYAGV